jgi:hypothetical protein
MSAPNSSGRTTSGVENVASTPTSAPAAWAAAAMAGTSGTAISGLLTVSSQTSAAPSSAAMTAAVSAMSTVRIVNRPSCCCAPKMETEPEYIASGTTATAPAGSPSMTAASAAMPLPNARAVPPSSVPSAASNELIVGETSCRE